MYCPEEGILATGDLFAPGVEPYVDSRRIAHFDRWIGNLAAQAARKGTIRMILPGHGDPLTMADLEAILAFVREKKALFEGRESAWVRFVEIHREHGLDHALAELRKMSASPDRFYLIHSELDSYGFEMMMNGQVGKALELFTELSDLFPDSDVAFDSLGEALVRLEEKERAAEAFRRALELNPDNRNSAHRLEALNGS